MSVHRIAADAGLHEAGRLWLFAGFTVAAVCGSRWLPAGGPWMALAVVSIAIAVWHGAFDGVLAEETFGPRYGKAWAPVFYGGYLVLGAVVIALWWKAPGLALALFLLYSALHFGTESEQQISLWNMFTGLGAGMVPLAAACHWWPGEVNGIFVTMLRGDAGHGAAITLLAGRLLWPAAGVVAGGALVRMRRRQSGGLGALVLVATELLLFRGCTPLAAFAVFFCLWHTPEHMVSTSLDAAGVFEMRTLWQHLRRGLVPWLLSLGALGVAGWYGRHTVEAYAGLLFVVLSALTVPHMALGELCRRRGNSAMGREDGAYALPRAVSLG